MKYNEFDKVKMETELRNQYKKIDSNKDCIGIDSNRGCIGIASIRNEGVYIEMEEFVRQGLSEGEAVKRMLKILEKNYRTLNHPLYPLRACIEELSENLRCARSHLEEIKLIVTELMSRNFKEE